MSNKSRWDADQQTQQGAEEGAKERRERDVGSIGASLTGCGGARQR